MSNDILRDFSLDTKAISVLISLQRKFISNDIAATSNENKKSKKVNWNSLWVGLVNNGFEEFKKENSEQQIPKFLNDDVDLRKKINEMGDNPTQKGIILLELVSFHPYFQTSDETKQKSLKIDSKAKKQFLKDTSKLLGFDPDRAEQLQSAMKSTTNSMTKKWSKLGVTTAIGLAICAATAGAAAPYIGAWIGGTMGLYGAAATVAGLAAIGGGSIAAGGLGIAGGTYILVGGGAILGLGAGFTSGQILHNFNSVDALSQAVKLEVALKEIVLQGQYDTYKTQEILFKQRSAIDNMEKELDRLRLEVNKDDKRIKDLENATKIIRESLRRNQDTFRKFA